MNTFPRLCPDTLDADFPSTKRTRKNSQPEKRSLREWQPTCDQFDSVISKLAVGFSVFIFASQCHKLLQGHLPQPPVDSNARPTMSAAPEPKQEIPLIFRNL